MKSIRTRFGKFGERVKSRKDCIVFCFAVCIFDNVLL